MHLTAYEEAVKACRFCFMCRHLSAVGNVTCRESDTPRGRALVAEALLTGIRECDPDYVEACYRAELSGANRTHCVSHYDEVGIMLAARRDIVEAGLAPEPVRRLAESLQSVDFKVSGRGEVLYLLDPYQTPDEAPSGCRVLSGGDPGKALESLGFQDASDTVFARFCAAVETSGCRTLVTASPATYHLLKTRQPDWRVLLGMEWLQGKRGDAMLYLLDSDYLRHYCDDRPSARQTLETLGYTVLPFGTNREESVGAGEGAVVFDRLYPELTRQLCARIAALADHPGTDILVTPSPYTRTILNRYAPELTVRLLDTVLTEG